MNTTIVTQPAQNTNIEPAIVEWETTELKRKWHAKSLKQLERQSAKLQAQREQSEDWTLWA